MAHWQQNSIEERLQILEIASAAKELPKLAVEKDWWVTMVLKALSRTQYANLLSFKGGTSLSKGWNLIQRFSEDIDVAIKREGRFAINGTSNTQLAKARRTARHYVIKELPEELDKILHDMGVSNYDIEAETEKKGHELRADTHPSVLYVNYESILPEMSEYLLPKVKIEFSCLSMDEPVEQKTIRSFISDIVPEGDDTSAVFNTVIPTRTFLEKIFLLHEEFQKENPRSVRMSRHLYDIERIMNTKFGIKALRDLKLYNDIITHRSIFNKMPHVDYSTHTAPSINFIPPADLIEDWRSDYLSLANSFIYENAEKKSFDELLESLEELTLRIRKMKDDTD